MPETLAVTENQEPQLCCHDVTKRCPFAEEADWLRLPYELWLSVLVEYGLCSTDLVSLDYACRWFSNCWGGSVTEEAARLIIKKYKRRELGELVNRVSGASWKEKLHMLEGVQARMATLSAGSYQNIAISRSGLLLTWGAGKFGQLGDGQYQDSVHLQNITSSIPPEAGQVTQVSAGCGHSGFITDKGEAYTCGDNRYYQLGHSSFRGQTCPVPTRVCKGLGSVRCLQIACGSSHTLFLTDMGQVYVSGQGDSGQLGLGPHVHAALIPQCITFPYNEYSIVSITAGIAHNVLLSDCGKAFTFGLATVGQLGHGGTKNLHQPTLVSVLRNKKIMFAAAGVCHTIFVDSNGHVFTCGKGSGQLGHGDIRIRTVPTAVASLEGVHISKAVAGVGRSIFISSSGRGYWCGEEKGEAKNHTTVPTLMVLPEPLLAASIGNSHVVLQMKSGRMMSIGNNGRFQTGHVTEAEASISTYTYIDSDLNV